MPAAASPLWYVDRSAGEVALLLLTAVVVTGILRASLPAAAPVLTEGLHVRLAAMTCVFAAVHVTTALADPFAHLIPLDAVIPFASRYRPEWLGIGVVSAYLFAAAALSSWPARRLPHAAWSWLHRLMYAGWLMALVHSLGTGSDAANRVFLGLDLVAAGAAFSAFVGYRVAEGMRDGRLLWGSLAAAATVAVVAVAAWTFLGPLEPGWARAAGTPPGLLHGRG